MQPEDIDCDATEKTSNTFLLMATNEKESCAFDARKFGAMLPVRANQSIAGKKITREGAVEILVTFMCVCVNKFLV